MTEYGLGGRFPAPGFTHANGAPAELFSSDNAATVLRQKQPVPENLPAANRVGGGF